MPNFKQALEQAVHEATDFAQSVQDLDLEILRSRLPLATLQQTGKLATPLIASLIVTLSSGGADGMIGWH